MGMSKKINFFVKWNSSVNYREWRNAPHSTSLRPFFSCLVSFFKIVVCNEKLIYIKLINYNCN